MPNSDYEAIDVSLDERVELHLFWNRTDNRVDVAIYFDQLPIVKKIILERPPIVTYDPNGKCTTSYIFRIVPHTTPGSFYYFDDEIFGKPHDVVAEIKDNESSQAKTTAILN